MAVLKAMVLSDCGGSSSDDDGCHDSGDKDAMAETALVTIALVALAIAQFITRHILANTIIHVIPFTIAFVGVQ